MELSAVGESSATRTRIRLGLDMDWHLFAANIPSTSGRVWRNAGGKRIQQIAYGVSGIRRGWRLALDDAVADGVVDEFDDGVNVQLQHDIGSMRLCGAHADAENSGHFLVAFALGQELHDFTLALRQAAPGTARGRGRAGAPRAKVGGALGEPGREI